MKIQDEKYKTLRDVKEEEDEVEIFQYNFKGKGARDDCCRHNV